MNTTNETLTEVRGEDAPLSLPEQEAHPKKKHNRKKKEVKPEEAAAPAPVKTAQDALYGYLEQPDVKANLIQSAINLSQRFRNNNFTIEQIVKKTNVKDPISARQLMNLLLILGYAKQQELAGEMKYKIVLKKEHRLYELGKQILELESQLRQVKELMSQVEAEVEQDLS